MAPTDLFGGETPIVEPNRDKYKHLKNKSGGWIKNPMHISNGELPDKKCKDCIFLYGKHSGSNKTFYKCEKWSKNTASPSDDHKLRWTACGLFQSETNT